MCLAKQRYVPRVQAPATADDNAASGATSEDAVVVDGGDNEKEYIKSEGLDMTVRVQCFLATPFSS